MQVSDIVVGKKYRDIRDINKEQIFLGIGMRKLYTENEFTEKHLVIIKSENDMHNGRMVQEGENVVEGYWDYIVEADSGLFMMS